MPIYLYESVDLVPGQTAEYLRGYVERYLPLNDEYDSEFLRLSGFFMPSVLYSAQPRLTILWTMPDWTTWNHRAPRSAEEELRKNKEYYVPALAWRTGWTDKILQPLGFSPIPATRPEIVRTGASVIDHQFLVKPEHCHDFVGVFEQDVMPAAGEAGMRLELIARAVGRPTEYIALWSLPDKATYSSWRESRSPDDPGYGMPGFERAWPLVTDVVERELAPAPFSPLGGKPDAQTRDPKEHVVI